VGSPRNPDRCRGVPRIAVAAGGGPRRTASRPSLPGGDHEGDPLGGVGTGLCGLAGARDEKADPVGTWKCEYAIGDVKRESTLKIKKDGDKFAGTMSWPDQKEAKLKDVKFKDGTLSFSAERN